MPPIAREPFEVLSRHTIFFSALYRNASGPNRKKLGSAGLIAIAGVRFFVTAYHVWQGIERFCERAQRCPVSIQTEKTGFGSWLTLDNLTLADCSDDLDLAVLSLPNIASLDLGNKAFFSHETRNSMVPRENDLVYIVGYPKQLFEYDRLQNTTKILSATIALTVSSVSPKQICLANSYGDWVVLVHTAECPRMTEVSGMSGSPAFLFRGGSYHFVGVLKEGWEVSKGAILLARAEHIGPGGRCTPAY